MKKGLITIVCLIALSVTAIPAGAQTRQRRYEQRYDQRVYSGRRYHNRGWYDNRSVWDKHRDKITTAAGAGGGALVGGLFGRRKGRIVGARAGGRRAALYSYQLRYRNNWNRHGRYEVVSIKVRSHIER